MSNSLSPTSHTQTISPASTAHNSTTDLIARADTRASMNDPAREPRATSEKPTSSQQRPAEGEACGNEQKVYWEGQKQERNVQNTCTLDDPSKNVNTTTSTTAKVVFPPWKRNDRWSGWMGDTVTAQSLVLCLILQAFSTGILDATTYLDFSTFASNQTGNTILLTVAIVRVSGHLLLLTGVSLASFLSAALVFGHIGHFVGVRRRIWLLLNVFCQIIFLILSAIFLSPSGPAQTRLGAKHEWVIISLFAVMSGAQVSAARQASIQEIPTAPMTSSYVDLVSDKYLFVGFNHKHSSGRNRRLAYISAMIIGSFIGGIMHKYAGSWVVVVVAMGFKLAVMGLMAVAPPEIKEKKEKESGINASPLIFVIDKTAKYWFKYWRGPSRFAVPLPEGLDPAAAAPLFCGGVTVYIPLRRYGAGTSAKNVGVIGIGGLGHMAIQIAQAMGAEVTAISRVDAKKSDSIKLGAGKYIATGGQSFADAFKGHERSLNLIICTSNPAEFPVAEYLPLLRPEGIMCFVGIIPKPLEVLTFPLIRSTAAVAGSKIGSPDAIASLLQLAVDKGFRPWVEKWNMDDINRAMPAFKRGEPKYRYVLVNVDNGGKL
ncbi:hypothetical protein I204_05590 [Kwoniella mangroviensis CBS 8886]|nr:hypothetical protein I204_05590 [Kwoniella mangroviensis CBS 8886]